MCNPDQPCPHMADTTTTGSNFLAVMLITSQVVSQNILNVASLGSNVPQPTVPDASEKNLG